MGELLSYSIKGGFLMFVMYAVYKLLMAKDNQPAFNRLMLLLIYLVSFTSIPLFDQLTGGTINSISHGVSLEGNDIIEIDFSKRSFPLWGTIILWVFLSGMAVTSVRTVITWIRISHVIRTGKKIRLDGYTLVMTDNDNLAPFSWLRYVVISKKDYDDDNCSSILIHEYSHIASRHWIDLCVAQAVCIINWFNPVAWLMRNELMMVHEYQADLSVVESGLDMKDYQMLLIEKAVGSRFPSLTNSLNHSKLKKRITMMYKQKSGARQKIKALALVPALALALGMTTLPAVRAAAVTLTSSKLSVGKVNENLSDDKTRVQVYQVTNINNDGGNTTVVIRGEGVGDNISVSGGTYSSRGKTYHAKEMSCVMTDGVAIISVTFPVGEDYDKNARMTLEIDGKEIPFILDNFFKNPRYVERKPNDSKKNSVSSQMRKQPSKIKNNGNESSVMDQNKMEYYLDGKKISSSELTEIPAERIVSITVDKERNAIMIATQE